MYSSGITLASISRQVDSLTRKFARKLAIYHLKPVTDQITELWAIAVAKKQPLPDPLSCVRKVVDAGFRLNTYTALHTYLKDCRRYGGLPDAGEIIRRLLPPKQRVTLDAVLPGRFPLR